MFTARITRAHSLPDLEKFLTEVAILRVSPIKIEVPENFGSQFFKESWMIGLLATAARSTKRRERLTIEHSGNTKQAGPELHFKSPFGLARVVYGAQGGTPSSTASLIATKGLVVFGGTQLFTIFAVDPEAPIPVVLGRNGRDEFLDEFRRLKRKRLETGQPTGLSTKYPLSDRLVSELALELFQNTLQHGRFSSTNEELPGLRYLSLARHIGNQRDSLVARAAGFRELQQYLVRVVPEKGTFAFLEIVIGDAGIGLVDRFLSTRRDMKVIANSPITRLGVINRIIKDRLSSKGSDFGAGSGISNALSAIAKLEGFISLRSGSDWLCRDYSGPGKADDLLLRLVSTDDLAPMTGTHYNILLPLK